MVYKVIEVIIVIEVKGQQLPRRKHQAEAQVVAAVAGRVVAEAARHAAAPRVDVPTAAAKHAILAR